MKAKVSPIRWLLVTMAVASSLAADGSSAQSRALSLDFRLTRSELKCLVQRAPTLLPVGDRILFSPDMCISDEALAALLGKGDRTALPSGKRSLPGSAGSRRSTRIRKPTYVFTQRTLDCLVRRAGQLRGDPVHIKLNDCPRG